MSRRVPTNASSPSRAPGLLLDGIGQHLQMAVVALQAVEAQAGALGDGAGQLQGGLTG